MQLSMSERSYASRDASDQHFVQLFDCSASVPDAVAAFVRDGLLTQEISLLAVTREHRLAITDRLRETGVDVDRAEATGQLIIRDAAQTLKLFERLGRLDPLLFDATIGAQIRQLSARGRVRVYGEIVDLLAAQGDFAGARRLEDMWNDLRRLTPLTLFCGYSSENFGDPVTASSLRAICRTHSHAVATPEDLLDVRFSFARTSKRKSNVRVDSSRGRRLVPGVDDAAPLTVRVAAPDRYGSSGQRQQFAVRTGHDHLVVGAHVGELAVQQVTSFDTQCTLKPGVLKASVTKDRIAALPSTTACAGGMITASSLQ